MGRSAARIKRAPGSLDVGQPRAATAGARTRVTVLGATGSVGASALDLLARNPDAFEVVALTANSNVEGLAAQAVKHRARMAAIGDPAVHRALSDRLAGTGIAVLPSHY